MSLILITLLSLSLFAQTKHVAILGGGGEPQGETTIFDSQLENLGKFFSRNNNTNLRISYNGGHSKTEQILKDEFKVPASSFTKSEFEAILNDFETKIKNGSIKSGDQIVLYITTHGIMNEESEKTHTISTAGSGSPKVSLDRLEGLSKLADEKGVKLGIIDGSCFSGSSITLKNPNTCIITATGSKNFGYVSFLDAFSKQIKKGKSLEDIFLATLKKELDPGTPMISSSNGEYIQDKLYELLRPYLQFDDKQGDLNMKHILEDQIIQNKCDEIESHFQKIIGLTKDVQQTISTASTEFKILREALTDYYQFQSKIRKDLKDMDIRSLNNANAIICEDPINPTPTMTQYCAPMPIKEILSLDVDSEMARYENRLEENSANKHIITIYLKKLKAIKAKKEELLQENPSYAQYMKYYKTELPNFQQETLIKAYTVSRALRDVYVKTYKSLKPDRNYPNPCQEIRF